MESACEKQDIEATWYKVKRNILLGPKEICGIWMIIIKKDAWWQRKVKKAINEEKCI